MRGEARKLDEGNHGRGRGGAALITQTPPRMQHLAGAGRGVAEIPTSLPPLSLPLFFTHTPPFPPDASATSSSRLPPLTCPSPPFGEARMGRRVTGLGNRSIFSAKLEKATALVFRNSKSNCRNFEANASIWERS